MSRNLQLPWLLACLLLASCGGEGGAGVPVALPAGLLDASADVLPDVQEASVGKDAAPDGAPPRRTVAVRNPFGNVHRTDNLLLDGDFEWLAGYTSQYPWLSVGGFIIDFQPPTVVAGYRCHSGLRCAAVGYSESAAGIGVRSRDPYLKVSAWARPPASTPDCTLATISVGACFYTGEDGTVPAVDAVPGTDGWCRYEAVVEAPVVTPCVFVTNEFDDTMLLDDVVMEASAEPGDRTRSAVKPSARHLSAVGRLRDSVREHLQPKPPEWAQPGPLERWTVQ